MVANGSDGTTGPSSTPAQTPLLARPGRPGREREVDGQRHRDVGLGDEHGARLSDHGPGALGWREEAVLGPFGFGGVEPPGDPDGAVGQDPPFDLAGGLLRADEDDAEGAAALGDVQQDLPGARGRDGPL